MNFLVFLPDFFLRFFDRYAVLRLMELLDLFLQNVYLNLAIFLLTVELHRLGSDFLQNLFYLVVLVGQFFDFAVADFQDFLFDLEAVLIQDEVLLEDSEKLHIVSCCKNVFDFDPIIDFSRFQSSPIFTAEIQLLEEFAHFRFHFEIDTIYRFETVWVLLDDVGNRISHQFCAVLFLFFLQDYDQRRVDVFSMRNDPFDELLVFIDELYDVVE